MVAHAQVRVQDRQEVRAVLPAAEVAVVLDLTATQAQVAQEQTG